MFKYLRYLSVLLIILYGAVVMIMAGLMISMDVQAATSLDVGDVQVHCMTTEELKT